MQVPLTTRNYLFFRNVATLYFIHTPKCGGTYVQQVFSPYIENSPTMTLAREAGHLTWAEYRDFFHSKGDDIQQTTTFSIARNPWDWHVSWFHYIKNDPGGCISGHVLEHQIFQEFEFTDYVHWLDDPESEKGPQGYFLKQVSDWFVDETGQIAVDHVLRQESLEEDLSSFVSEKNLAIEVKSLSVNASDRGDYRSYYDSETRQIIEQRHARDISLLGYSF